MQLKPAVCSLIIHHSSDYFTEESDEENEDPELGKAIRKMKRLDRILALKATAEREVKQKGMEQHQRLWQELQVRLYIRTHRNFIRMPLFFGNSDTRYRLWVSGWAAMRWKTPDAFWHWHPTTVSHKYTCKDTYKIYASRFRCKHDQMLFPFMHFSSGLWRSGFHLCVWDWSSRSEEHETRDGR